jgi:Tol biopolymer transport system component
LIQITDYALNAGHPGFSPDGHRLAFVTTIAVVNLLR